MSDEFDSIPPEALQREFTFDKFVEDLAQREQARRDAQSQQPFDQNRANRERDARNRETLHNRIRWGR